ncbi:hypothetical protein BH10ACI2_BH10ACI2_09680 [soil metagenome]
MKVVVHWLVHVDVLEAMEFYEKEGGTRLAVEFFSEYERTLELIRQRPYSFAITKGVHRRVNFDRFPFHAIFTVMPDFALMLVVRHDRRNPDFGLDR